MKKQQFGAVLVSVACLAGLALASADNPASVRLIVPANAEVWFDGNKMSEPGTVRDYVSPTALVPGSEYSYQVRVRWTKNGQPVDQTRKVIVGAGALTTVDFTTAAAAQGSDKPKFILTQRTSDPKFTPKQAKALEDWSYALALDAATYGSPAVIMYLLRYNDAVGPKPLAPPNQLWRMDNISTPELSEKSGYVLPNCSVLYGFGFLDLRREPLILTLPNSEGRYYMVECVDMWTNAFAYPAGVVAGYNGGKFAMTAPGWKGKLPEGVQRINCPTPWILIQPRVHMPEPSQLTSARKVLAEITTQGLAEFTGQPAPPAPADKYLAPQRKNPKLPVSAMDFDDPLQFWEIMSAVMNENPPPADQVKALLPMFKPLGIELGKQWDRSKVDPIVLKAMARAAETIPIMLTELPFGRLTNGWFIPPPTIGDPKTDYKIRAIVARVGLTANTPREAIYFDGKLDADGKPLTGARNYTITFKEAHRPNRNRGSVERQDHARHFQARREPTHHLPGGLGQRRTPQRVHCATRQRLDFAYFRADQEVSCRLAASRPDIARLARFA